MASQIFIGIIISALVEQVRSHVISRFVFVQEITTLLKVKYTYTFLLYNIVFANSRIYSIFYSKKFNIFGHCYLINDKEQDISPVLDNIHFLKLRLYQLCDICP